MISTFISALALFNSLTPEHNWLVSRLKAIQNASIWISFPEEKNQLTPSIKLNKNDTNLVVNSFSVEEFKKFGDRDSLKAIKNIENKKFPKHINLSFPAYCINNDSSIDFNRID